MRITKVSYRIMKDKTVCTLHIKAGGNGKRSKTWIIKYKDGELFNPNFTDCPVDAYIFGWKYWADISNIKSSKD